MLPEIENYERAMDAMFPVIKRILWYEYVLSANERVLPDAAYIQRPGRWARPDEWTRYRKALVKRDRRLVAELSKALAEYERLRRALWRARHALDEAGVERRPEVASQWALGRATYHTDEFIVSEA